MAKGPPEVELFDEALALVTASQGEGATEASSADQAFEAAQRLASWRAQSAAHERAATAAERFVATTARLSRPPLSPKRKLGLELDLWWSRQEPRVPMLLTAAALCLALVLGVLFNLEPQRDAELADVQAVSEERHETPWQTQKTLVLSDGSTVWLDWSSRILVHMSEDERRVELITGKAAFAVTSDSVRPFIVQAGVVTTRVTGTEFVVQRRGDDVNVAVVEGAVRVTASSQTASLVAEQGVRAVSGTLEETMSVSAREISAWREGRLVFRDRPLREALRALDSYTTYQLDASELADTTATVTGTFFIDRAHEAIASIAVSQNLERDFAAPDRLVLRPSKNR